MSDLALILGVAAITFASRASFLIWPRPVPEGKVGRFLETFPIALFVAIAVSSFEAPTEGIGLAPNLVAAAGGVVGAVVFRRSLWGVLVVGAVCYYAARALMG